MAGRSSASMFPPFAIRAPGDRGTVGLPDQQAALGHVDAMEIGQRVDRLHQSPGHPHVRPVATALPRDDDAASTLRRRTRSRADWSSHRSAAARGKHRWSAASHRNCGHVVRPRRTGRGARTPRPARHRRTEPGMSGSSGRRETATLHFGVEPEARNISPSAGAIR